MRLRSRVAVLFGLVAFALVSFGPMAQPASAYTWVWPTTGRITQGYGCTGFSWEPPYGDCRHFHKGIDIANSAWTKIRAASSGVVTFVGYNPYDPIGDQAWIVKIKHDNGLLGLYAHMKPVRVDGARKGDRVRAGQLIGYMGATGMATGVHLHFGFFRDGIPKNPKNYITYPCCSLNYSGAALAGGPSAATPETVIELDAPRDQPRTPNVPVLQRRLFPLPV
jgi:murein DD-endopeptidase MepM/ murein hydrolase activator NlpD